jgi:hypothetical protein
MEKEPIYNESYLTESEEDSKDEKYINFYNFISTKVTTNIELMNYLWELGLFAKEDIIFLEEDWIRHIYDLLDEKGRITIRKNYLRDIRKIINNPNFNFY